MSRLEPEVLPTKKSVMDPEDRIINESDPDQRKEKMQGRTLADSLPASDPPPFIPDPSADSFTL